jgi:3-hydroxyacyl-CoA dehydrogenase
MVGGDLSEATLVSERYLLDLEREVFVCIEKKKTLKEPTHVNQRKTVEKLKL